MKILVYGAGAIGQYVGGMLAHGGAEVHLIGRPALVSALAAAPLQVQDLDGSVHTIKLTVSAALAEAPANPDLVILTVKGPATAEAAADLARHVPAATPVLSFQNGVDNVARISAAAPGLAALAGMVPYNVVQIAPGQVRRTSDGQLMAERAPITEALLPICAKAGLALALRSDMRAVQWGKLLLNLNNPLNALSGLPLRQQLLDRRYRCLLADLQQEALAVLDRAAEPVAQVTPLPPRWLPRLLRLPTWLFKPLAARMLKISPEARSSMYDDRLAGRPTEIDDLCGAVVRCAERSGATAAANAALLRLVSGAPAGRWFSAAEIRSALGG
ncbi:MAG: 2-dehydropantoate 2-reductase [Lysobacterales bacterium]